MSKIQNYTNDALIKGSDKVLGSSYENNLWVTRNYSMNSLASFFVNYLSQNGVSYDLAQMTTDINTNNTSISTCLLYTSPSPRDATLSRMPSSA